MTPLSPGACISCSHLESSIRSLTAQNIDSLTRAAALEAELRALQRTHTLSSSIDNSSSGVGRHDSARGRQDEDKEWALKRAEELERSRRRSVERSREALARERAARVEAEDVAARLAAEMEELSVRLFEEANAMVRAEREARAKLEERVGYLESREEGRARRLERIEGALVRLKRVRGLLGDG